MNFINDINILVYKKNTKNNCVILNKVNDAYI